MFILGFSYVMKFSFLRHPDAPSTGPYPTLYREDGKQYLKIRAMDGMFAFSSYHKYLILYDAKTNLPLDYIRYGEFPFEPIYFDNKKIVVKVDFLSHAEEWEKYRKPRKKRLGKYLVEYELY